MTQYDFYAHKPAEKYHKSDVWLFISILLLWGLGMFTIFVCSQGYAARFFNNDAFYFVKRQLICSAAGVALFFAFLIFDMQTIKNCTRNTYTLCFNLYKTAFYRKERCPPLDKVSFWIYLPAFRAC